VDGVKVRGASYEIVVHGHLGRAMTGWFEGVEVEECGPEDTKLVGWFQDQAALQGFLGELGDLGLELSAVRRLEDTD